MNFNYILVWTVCLSCIAFLVRAWRSHPRSNQGWIIVSSGILSLTLFLLLIVPQLAGFIGGVLWGLLLLTPMLGFSRVNQLVYQQRYRQARNLASYLRWLHPADGWLEQPQLLRALEKGKAGKIEEAFFILENYRTDANAIGRDATILLYWMSARWQECLTWLKENFSEQAIYEDPGLLMFYLRSLGETGELNHLLEGIEKSEVTLEKLGDHHRLNLLRLYGFAFCGYPRPVGELLEGPLANYGELVKRFWQLTAQMASGNQESAREELLELQSRGNFTLNHTINWRLSRDLAKPPQKLTPASKEILARLEKEMKQEARYSGLGTVKGKQAYATFTLVGLNLFFFALEIYFGGSTNPETLSFLGALEADKVWNGEWWRVINANFLHYGFLHLTMNMIGLYFLGPYVEATLGRLNFLLIYLGSGVGTMLTFCLIALHSSSETPSLVGASAAIMGLLGAMGAILLQGWRLEKARIAGKRLRIFFLIVTFQIIFDAIVPQVSGLSHILGLIFGFVVATVMLINGQLQD